DPSAMLEQSPAAIYCALDDARSDILTLCREVQRLSAALAAQPAASAEPTEQDLLILFGMWGWQTADGREFRFEHFKEMARHLVGRYGAPVAAQAPAAAGDEQ